MEGKKISFGFMKTKKADKIVVEEQKDFIECVEENAIKVVGGDVVKESNPLVIPMKPNTLVTAERLKHIAEIVESSINEPDIVEKPPTPQDKPPDNETLDEMAVRELLQEAKKEVVVETQKMTVPLPAKPVNEGEKESTLDDYESVPVQDFGMAMLRGMGWAPNKETSAYKQPPLRPKGLGLGADKVVKNNQKQNTSKGGKDEELAIVKNAYVKITTGKFSGYYGKVVSLDEDNGRVMVDIAVKKETVSLSEFMMHPVNKSEYDKESKVINAGSYEEYKKKEVTQKSKNNDRDVTEQKGQDRDREEKSEREATSSRSERESKEVARNSKNGKDEERNERDRDRSRRQRHASEERKKRHSSSESLDSLSDSERKRHKKKERKRYSSHDSLSSSDKDRKKKNKKKDKKRRDPSSESDYRSKRHKTPEGKRDIDKKRKGKKKKRDRDRSPNYRKHRK